MEVIILAGGLGTRLQGVIGAYPKCMAPVNERPFLAYIFDYLSKQSVTRVILSLGYKHEVVTEWLDKQDLPFVVDYVVEHHPLGTGGGIQLAMKEAVTDNVFVINGDTMFMVNLKTEMDFHHFCRADTTLALKKMTNFDRYGIVNTNMTRCITSFEEKQHKETGYINGGVYIINSRAFFSKHLPEKFSFEKDYLERYAEDGRFYGFLAEDYFIDIGIPEDYTQAQSDFKTIFS